MNNEEVYKKKYLEALEKAWTILEYYKRPEYKDVFDYAKEDLPGIFPELKEQIEDEKKAEKEAKKKQSQAGKEKLRQNSSEASEDRRTRK